MRTVRKPSRRQVRRALDAWATFTRPPDPENGTAPPVGVDGAEGTAGRSEHPDDADAASEFLSDAIGRNFDRGRER